MFNQLTLPEAIREGCKNTEKAIHTYRRTHAGKLECCAMGAAAIAVGLKQELYMELILGTFPVLNTIVHHEKFPDGLLEHLSRSDFDEDGDAMALSLHAIVSTLNDDAGWTREQIADWLEENGYV
jgi:hypothetical protein